jgi:dinuclear metal center YbgI/SA1388 family protein
MKISDICNFLDSRIPLSFQESYDNCGLQIGNRNNEVSSALISFDVNEDVVDEAIKMGCGLIISHHPLIFDKIKTITGKTYIDRIIINAIKNDISIYAAHTNLDIINGGVSFKMASILGLKDIKVLSPAKDKLLKLVTYVPESHLENVRKALFNAGAGKIGNYDCCCFTSDGMGSFRPSENTKPFVGEKGKIHFENEIKIEIVLLDFLKEKVVDALIEAHPYEEVAFDILKLENAYSEAGLGCVGDLPDYIDEKKFLDIISVKFNAKGIRFSGSTNKNIKRVSVCGGAGISLLNDAVASGSQAFITGDVKYHNFFDVDNRLLLVDIGHFESEIFATEILYDLIIKKFPKFAVRFSEINTNPINYL